VGRWGWPRLVVLSLGKLTTSHPKTAAEAQACRRS
jgi:hypothetical protein